MLAFTAARLLTPTDAVEHPLLLVEQGRFLEVAAKSSLQTPAGISLSDFGDGVIVPGYVDLHVHGGAGFDVMDDDGKALPAIEDCSRGMGSRVFPDHRHRSDRCDAARTRTVGGRNRGEPIGRTTY